MITMITRKRTKHQLRCLIIISPGAKLEKEEQEDSSIIHS